VAYRLRLVVALEKGQQLLQVAALNVAFQGWRFVLGRCRENKAPIRACAVSVIKRLGRIETVD